MNRVYYTLFLFLSLAIADAPIWDELPASQIQEDCLSGCENGVFSIDLELFVEDPGNTGEEEGIATIEIIGEVPGASLAEIVEGTVLSITPELNWDQDILVSLIATDLNGDESEPA